MIPFFLEADHPLFLFIFYSSSSTLKPSRPSPRLDPSSLFSNPKKTRPITSLSFFFSTHPNHLTKISPHLDSSSPRFTSPKFHQIVINFSKGFQGASRDLIYIKT
ncbi:hypothetical protein RchiOBHm_Chr5g0078751 [Rosa chinensis]|uniref:Uncharacterized protein n=1 Tax=Rosa chinensis TaxID=74649 RepID=A0A2P6QMC0_ROSCH|nr:hypothetical protein RchiOBHm_Chr5g0078751 [Rosa chinensis]